MVVVYEHLGIVLLPRASFSPGTMDLGRGMREVRRLTVVSSLVEVEIE